MSELLYDKVFENEEQNMGSVIHSGTQAKLVGLLFNDEKFSLFTELSLDTTQIDLSQFGLKSKDELKPDVCLYTNPPEVEPPDDIVKTTQMPDLAIEILSPSQTVSELIAKIKAYFALNIKSCWLVIPALTTINVFTQPKHYKTFTLNDSEVVDELMDIHLPIVKLFHKSS
ncbi:MAG: hypothetical protein DRQ49_13120 [Gammaproteobacteria bacterium]|nr:MAG: hypothetical protein DRQ49_13120 [Gammaproteobacteria bacterium]RKZ44968.1 MAG: hypothetical protein DRQ41_01445 [Gammaproteobacteria bacterium]RKZ73209.1 MAG: hypothetical protein DRQ57_15105 [Gammaproteobacteria bacterium]